MKKTAQSSGAGCEQPDIVLIEDETLIRQMLQIMLRRERGWKRVTGFGNGAEGLAHCLKSPPDLLIVDLDLPGKTGWEIAAELKKRVPRTLILILTSNVMRHKPSDFLTSSRP